MSSVEPSKKRRARRGEALPGTATLVVPGDILDPVELRADALDNFDVYGYFGLSVFAEVGGVDLEWIATHKLARVEWLVVFRAGDVLNAGLELWDTDLSPHYDVVHEDVDELVRRLVACPIG